MDDEDRQHESLKKRAANIAGKGRLGAPDKAGQHKYS
jgi:hypothetical protein